MTTKNATVKKVKPVTIIAYEGDVMVEQGDSLESIEQANPEVLEMCPEHYPHLFDIFGNKI